VRTRDISVVVVMLLFLLLLPSSSESKTLRGAYFGFGSHINASESFLITRRNRHRHRNLLREHLLHTNKERIERLHASYFAAKERRFQNDKERCERAFFNAHLRTLCLGNNAHPNSLYKRSLNQRTCIALEGEKREKCTPPRAYVLCPSLTPTLFPNASSVSRNAVRE
jgi:hypothetical protein